MRRFPDARTLIVVVLLVTTLAIAINNPLWLGALLVVTVAALVATRISLFRLLRRLRRYRWFFFILALVQSLTHPAGQVFLAWQDYVLLSSGGLLAAVAVLLRVTIILAAALLLTLRDYQELVTGLVQMKVPYELAYMVLLGIRFIPVLSQEFQNSLTAIELRGIELKRIAVADKIRIYSYILMPTVAGAMIRARRVATAMEARAFRAKPRRTWLDWPRLSPLDWLVIILSLALGIVVWILHKGVVL